MQVELLQLRIEFSVDTDDTETAVVALADDDAGGVEESEESVERGEARGVGDCAAATDG